MRTTNNNIAKPTATLPLTIKQNQSIQTPIEIALKIDENGMTTASNLYTFLGLYPSNFTKWCNRNIVKNTFVTEMWIISGSSFSTSLLAI